MIGYMDSGFKKFLSIHDRLAIEMNRCIQEADIAKWMTKGKTPPSSRKTHKKEPLQTIINL